ncbi:TrbI/VirB10 family protein [Bradyrhizobium sp. INPA01-394B]|uniref:Type IV secretion system protein VirB10 n=1 Tax=Bradyrhizobium campsiandrae TaxID=1729892 RepID=A0ABR7U2G3_9BRAD|nr:type IV secretion system protein VirB10 [Bradyrhizobium campsiandrae]MBC9877547.1 TrbI/VirB10 family protein [Bradyrhizobium campsiandrae]MBC9978214.1 type IV secretion system protein VirB10 [Bradyrhizobium campsiandrae]
MPTPDDYRSFELEATAATSVARGRTALGSFLKFGVPIGALLVAAWMIYGTVARRSPTLTTPDKEEFTTTQFPAPSLSTPRVQTNQGTIVIPQAPAEPVPPPPPVAPPLALPAPPPPEAPLAGTPPNDDEARRLAELERQRQEEERRKWERLRAPQVIADNAAASANTATPDNGSKTATGPENDPNRRFLSSVSAAGVEVSRATKNNRIDALVAQGTMVRGVLETAVQSDLPGMVRAVVTENVWSFDGRRVLIPAGSRLVGEYKSGIAQGQTRVFVVWTRMLRSDGVSVQLGSNGTDDLGRAGNAGFVDNHYLERFGSAIMLSIVGGAAQFLSAYGQNTNTIGNGSIITTTDPVTGIVTQTQTGINQNQLSLQAREIAAQNVSQTLTNIAQQALRNSINIPPTIYLDQGTRIIVFVRRDLDFSALYPDPVKEALRELKRERAGAKSDGLH